MRKTGIGLLAIVAAALVVGCGGDVGGGPKFVGEVDLKATASGPGTITAGTNGEWTFTVSNAGPEPARDVAVDVGLDPAAGVLAEAVRWTCTANSGTCGAESGKGAPATTVSLDNGGSAVITVRTPVSYMAAAGAEVGATVTVGEDATYPDPTPGDNTATVAVTVGEPQAIADFTDEIIYWAFTDRFSNGDPTNDDGDGSRRGDEANPADAIAWHGGDFAGIRQKIEEGYFQGMGFTAIWISPVILQVPALNNGNAAYHGYWPEASLEIEPHFGTAAELKGLVDAAHAVGLKIIVDFVANHVGFDAQLVQTNPDWLRLGSGCGTSDEELCLAGLPDLRQENPEVEAFLLESLQNLVATTGVDAFRWDAQKHVNADFWNEAFAPGAPADRSTVWSVGEVFDGVEKVAFHLDALGTPSVLDFPLYSGFTTALGGFSTGLSGALASDATYSDPRRLSTFLDNHDVMRVTSSIIEQRGYDRAQALELLDAGLTFLYANRGVPVVYYGTEIGMEGLGDPFSFRDGNSNREDMDFSLAGDPTVLTCGVADQGNDNTFVNGEGAFLRGSFIDWADPAPAGNQLFNEGSGMYAQALELGAGTYFFKVAGQTWSGWERTYDATAVTPGTSVTLTTGGNNTVLELAADGCYRFEMDASASTDNPELTVTRLNVAAPLVRRIAALAEARQSYPALKDGTQSVVYDFARQCSVPPSLSDSPLPGTLFLRGGFNDWGATPETAFVRTGLNSFEAEFEVAAGAYGYKIAVEDWTFERVVAGQDTVLDAVLPLADGAGQPNGNLVIPADGCYNFAVDATDLGSMTLEVTADTDGTCEPVSSDPDAAAFGRPVYVRGSFNGFADPVPASDQFAATAPGVLSAKVGLPAGDIEYKIASADWSVERAVIGTQTRLDTSQLVGIPSGNGTLSIDAAGCYDWTLDVQDPEVAYLTVTKAADASDVFVLRRDLEGAASVVLVMNMGDGAADLAALGGIPVDGLADGAAVEITGADTDLVISGGVLNGTVPARTAYLVSDR